MSQTGSALASDQRAAELANASAELTPVEGSKFWRWGQKFVIAAIGAIPWVGGLIAAAAEIPAEEEALRRDKLRAEWLREHQRKLGELQASLKAIIERFESFGDSVEERIQSDEYLALVRQSFQTWDQAATAQKREYIQNLVANAAGTRMCSDDVVRLFIAWLASFHEAHFAIIRELHHNPGSTRGEMWDAIYGIAVREDSAEADLYRMLVRDLSTSGVIRQARDTNELGQFLRQRPRAGRSVARSTMKSSFDDSDQYVLTNLGKQFVHYTLLGEIRRLETR